MREVLIPKFFGVVLVAAGLFAMVMPVYAEGPLAWPVACGAGASCRESGSAAIGYPEIGVTAETSKCRPPAYKGHTGTDIYVTTAAAEVPVLAAAAGQVIWVTDGMYDRCPNPNEIDCKARITPICTAAAGSWGPEVTLSCAGTACNCLWGFNAGNFVLVRHDDLRGVAFTLYAHLQKGSITVKRGETVASGQQLATVGSSGNAARPHLHFGVWRSVVGNIELVNPWGNSCNGETATALWSETSPFAVSASLKEHQHTAPHPQGGTP